MPPKRLSEMKILGEEGQNQPRKDDTRQQPQNNNQHEHNRPSNNQEGQTTQNNWSHRPRNRDNNYQLNNRWNSRQNNQNTPRDNNQQINQVTTSNGSDEPEQTINQIEGNGESFSPYIRCLIDGEEIEVLVDTGATVSVLTKEVVDAMIKKNPRIPQLPVTGVKISSAVGKQICETSREVFCLCQFGKATIVSSFIQVEGLNERGIIGSDILNKYNAQIDFDNRTIRMKISGQIYFLPFSRKLPTTAPEEKPISNRAKKRMKWVANIGKMKKTE